MRSFAELWRGRIAVMIGCLVVAASAAARNAAMQAPATSAVAVVRAAWVQYGPRGLLEARAVISGDRCPRIAIDGHEDSMELRAAANADFPAICRAAIPAGARRIRVGGRRLPGAAAEPRRIVVIGDTGCRIKGGTVQACLDPRAWPFPRLARAEARAEPDLVIDVGDYLYRESPCPSPSMGCAGSPHGDHWATWSADFFAPAAPLLAAAPWVVVRGNHEDCARAGVGWLRLLGPRPVGAAGSCTVHLPPYALDIGGLHLIVMDDASAPDIRLASRWVPIYRREFASLASAATPSWLLMHRPIWGVIAGPLSVPIGGNRTLIAAIGHRGIPQPVSLMLAGHIHAFEVLNYRGAQRVPPQLIAGFGGDRLDRTPRVLGGALFQGDSGVTVRRGTSISGFGFVVMQRAAHGWRIDVHAVSGRLERRCWFRESRLGCASRP